MKTAIVHEWLTSAVGGGEDCLREIHSLFPSPIYTLVQNETTLKGSYFENLPIITSFIQRLPFARTKYRHYLPLFPLAVEQFDLSEFDCVLSSSHCVAKGVLVHPDQFHLCYCYTPMRYAWDLTHQYLEETRGIKKLLTKWCLHRLRQWDATSASRVDSFVAISKWVARRIKKYYGRDAHVIYPPVDTKSFSLHENKEDYYLTASRFVPYKKIDLIVEAFGQMPDKKLIVIGSGPDEAKIRRKAKKNVELLGYQPDAVLLHYLQRAKGFVFAAIEDFGILPIQAMSTGTPVIALRKGALTETLCDGVSGLFFEEQTPTALCDAIHRFEQARFEPRDVTAHAARFSRERFRREFGDFVREQYEIWKAR